MPMKEFWTVPVRMSSSSLTWIAALSRFCEFCIRKTIRNVTMVVPVLMTSCHVSENPNNGPVTAQITITAQASTKVDARPAACEALFAMDANSRLGCRSLHHGLPAVLFRPSYEQGTYSASQRLAVPPLPAAPRRRRSGPYAAPGNDPLGAAIERNAFGQRRDLGDAHRGSLSLPRRCATWRTG